MPHPLRLPVFFPPVFFPVAALIAFAATPALAYIGPGAGLTAIGTLLALFAALILAVVGFLWYPLKRLMRRGAAPAGADMAALEADPLEDIPANRDVPAPEISVDAEQRKPGA